MGDVGQRGFRQAGCTVPRGVAQLMADRTPVRAYGEVRVPALILTGDRSPVCAQRTAAILAAELPDARLEVLPGAGHMGPLTHMATVNALVAEHVAHVPDTRAQSLQRSSNRRRPPD